MDQRTRVIVYIVVSVLFVALLARSTFVVPHGHVAFRTGLVRGTPRELGPGMRLVFPLFHKLMPVGWDQYDNTGKLLDTEYLVNVRMQQTPRMRIELVTADNVKFHVYFQVTYHIESPKHAVMRINDNKSSLVEMFDSELLNRARVVKSTELLADTEAALTEPVRTMLHAYLNAENFGVKIMRVDIAPVTLDDLKK